MGWDSNSNWKTKADVVADQMAMYRRSETFEVVAHKSTTNGLWLVVRNRDTGLKGIIFDLIKKEQGTWGVKGMDESMGPYYYDCPAAFIDMVPPRASEAFMFNLAWRSQYRAANAGKRGFSGTGVGFNGVP
jgi:hypothetical protein